MENESKFRKYFIRYLLITCSSIIYALGIGLFLDPNNLAPGGVAGISVILSKFIPVNSGLLIILFNIPIMLFGFFKFGWRFMANTLYSTVLSSVMIDVITEKLVPVWTPTDNLMLCALAGGALMSVGMGLLLKNKASTGGIDIIIRAIRQKRKDIKSGTFYFIIDMAIIAASAIVFKNAEIGMYAAIAIVTSTTLLDVVLYGKDGAKLVYIISDRHKEIADILMKKYSLGVTYIDGEGAYTEEQRSLIMCVLKNHYFSRVRETVKNVDPKAFMIVTSASEIFGEGFRAHNSEEI